MRQSPTSGAVVVGEAGGRRLVVLRLGDREYGLATEVVVQVLRMVAIRPVPESPPWIAGSSTCAAARPRFAGGPYAVLYVEDNASNVRLVEQILRRQPAVLLTVALRGLEALDIAPTTRPTSSCSISTCPTSPARRSCGCCAGIPAPRRSRSWSSAPMPPDQAERLRGEGAQEYLTKPLDVRRLLEVLRDNLPAAQAVSRGGP